ncbi:MAG: UbiA family prenyltransferase [Gammaproteobacteria bacterium]
MQEPKQTAAEQTTLCVDLDGTLIRTDTLFESVCALLGQNILYGLLLPLWLLRGKVYLKQQIASRVDLQVELFPYNDQLLKYLEDQKAAGRRLVLATASHTKYATRIAEHVGVFDAVIATDSGANMAGKSKLEQIKTLVGGQAFDYVGNSKVDVAIWQDANAAVVVNPLPGVLKAAEKCTTVTQVIDDQPARYAQLWKAMRPHQWLKNILIFVPLLMAHMFSQAHLIVQASLAFVAFSLCASSVYLLNDLFDLKSDRQHPSKRFRPFASGSLGIVDGFFWTVVLLAVAFGIAMLLPADFVGVLGLYYLCTLAYSAVLKRAAIIDAIVLAGLYTLRLIAGAAAISVPLSFWLLAFSIFIFLSLAFIKRFSELQLQLAEGKDRIAGRAYREIDMETLAQLGTSSGYLAVMVLALYINSDVVATLYSRPEALWIFCPMMLYWISRLWLLTRRGEMDDDPVVFTIQDRRTWWLAVIATVAFGVAL